MCEKKVRNTCRCRCLLHLHHSNRLVLKTREYFSWLCIEKSLRSDTKCSNIILCGVTVWIERTASLSTNDRIRHSCLFLARHLWLVAHVCCSFLEQPFERATSFGRMHSGQHWVDNLQMDEARRICLRAAARRGALQWVVMEHVERTNQRP